jgi:hypothetical protein
MKTYYWLNQDRILSHLRTTFCALAIAGASLTLPSAEASGPPLLVSGQFFPCFTNTSFRQVGDNLIFTFNVGGTGTGAFTGSLINGTEMDVVHPDGSITLQGSLDFSGSLNDGPPGTLHFTYEGKGNFYTHHETLRGVGTQGTGGLAGVYANFTLEGDLVGTCAGDFGGQGIYTGQILVP